MTELEQELAKVPEGMPYCAAPNFPRIWELLGHGEPTAREKATWAAAMADPRYKRL
jgi:hypothetical protein